MAECRTAECLLRNPDAKASEWWEALNGREWREPGETTTRSLWSPWDWNNVKPITRSWTPLQWKPSGWVTTKPYTTKPYTTKPYTTKHYKHLHTATPPATTTDVFWFDRDPGDMSPRDHVAGLRIGIPIGVVGMLILLICISCKLRRVRAAPVTRNRLIDYGADIINQRSADVGPRAAVENHTGARPVDVTAPPTANGISHETSAPTPNNDEQAATTAANLVRRHLLIRRHGNLLIAQEFCTQLVTAPPTTNVTPANPTEPPTYAEAVDSGTSSMYPEEAPPAYEPPMDHQQQIPASDQAPPSYAVSRAAQAESVAPVHGHVPRQ